MADNLNRPPDTAGSPGQGNPLLPNNADNSNLTNRSGSLREVAADTASRAADVLTGPDDDTTMGAGVTDRGTFSTTYTRTDPAAAATAGTAAAGTYATGSRYYSQLEGREHISGLVANRTDAEAAVNRLETLGVPRSDISVVLRNESDTAEFAAATGTTDAGSKAGEGAGAGSVVGGTVGAILGALAATATAVAIPGVGIVVAGPIAGALAGAGAGGLTGGLLGALVGAGIPEDTARSYESGLQGGGVVVVADVPAHLADEARRILQGSFQSV